MLEPDALSRLNEILVGADAADDLERTQPKRPGAEETTRSELLRRELWRLRQSGVSVSLDQLRARFPEHSDQLAVAFQQVVAAIPGELTPEPASAEPANPKPANPKPANPKPANPKSANPESANPVPVSSESASQTQTTDASAGPASSPVLPESLGRYRVIGIIGSGGFGVVYQAWDEQLRRTVAIKVALRGGGSQREWEAELAEARFLAQLDHPGIVPVYDVGQADDGALYVVSKYIDGVDLVRSCDDAPFTHQSSARIVAKVADALDYAHRNGVVHRDVKPGNIILTPDGAPILVDFGLAIKDSDFGQGATFVGTPAYMSPEQARREGHRVDGRSDIYSLGAVLYGLLTGKRPFVEASLPALLELICNVEVRPLRQIDRGIPRDLERICLKALSKRVADRYATASDMAEDLRHWEASLQSAQAASIAAGTPASTSHSAAELSRATAIIPRGLRAFEPTDADFFLDLLPGPRDRDGLPESVSFWKTRIEETEAERSFGVGVLLGPSGSGKSSLVQAGIVPRLDNHVVTIVIEAGSQDLEGRLLKSIRKRIPALKSVTSLHQALLAVRQDRGLPAGSKLLLVFDQFEQWLNYHRGDETSELADALRQCDATRLQALLLIRDDFTLDAAHFMEQIEEPLSQTRNFATVDRFGRKHARSVLTAFGQAFGAIGAEATKEQQRFLDAAIEALVESETIVPIQLALLADMVKDKPWTPATLREYGGMRGIGIAFLEEKLNGPAAHPFLRTHGQLTRQLLESLLPEEGTLIKGRARTRNELLEQFSHLARPDTLERILNTLDSELRLITPSGFDALSSTESSALDREPAYQLTHDYLVPSIRSWVTASERATWRGRMRIRLNELAESWNARPEPRRLPTLLEWLSIRLTSGHRDWTMNQRRMMREADKRIAIRGGLLAGCLLVIVAVAYESQGRLRAVALRDRLLNADTSEVPEILDDAQGYERWTTASLRRALPATEEEFSSAGTPAEEERAVRRRVHLALGLLESDPAQLDVLRPRLARLAPEDLLVVSRLLATRSPAGLDGLWQVVEDPMQDRAERLAAGSVLAQAFPNDPRWSTSARQLAVDLVASRAFQLPAWIEHFRGIRQPLLPFLLDVIKNEASPQASQRTNVIELLSIYAADDPVSLAAAIEDARPGELAVFLEPLRRHGEPGQAALRELVERRLARPSQTATAPASLAEALTASAGYWGLESGIAHAVPLAAVPDFAQQLRAAGYRPVSVRPFVQGPQVWAALSWVRDDSTFQIALDLTADEWRESDEKFRQQGLVPADLAFYPSPDAADSSTRFAGLWVAPWSPDDVGDAYVDKPLAQHDALAQSMTGQGWLLRLAVRETDSNTLCSAIWIKSDPSDPPEWFSSSRYGANFGDMYPGYLETDCRLRLLDLDRPDASEMLAGVARTLGKSAVKDQALLASYLLGLGRYAEAKQTLDGLVEQQPELATIRAFRATALAGLGDLEGLRAEIARLESLPGDATATGMLRIREAVLLGDLSLAETRWKELEAALNSTTPDAETTLDLAQAAAVVARLAGASDATQANDWPDRAIDLLRRAVVEQRLDRSSLALQHTDFQALRGREAFQRLLGDIGLDRRYDAVWRTATELESKVLYDLPIEEHLRQCRQLAEQGYFPACVETHYDGVQDRRVAVSTWHREVPLVVEQWRLVERRTMLGLALAHGGETEYLLEILQDLHGRETRSLTVERAAASGLPITTLVAAFRRAETPLLRRSLLLALGGYPREALSDSDRDSFTSRLPALMTSASDPGLVAAALWCGRRWGLAMDGVATASGLSSDWRQSAQRWYRNHAGHSMVVLGPAEFLMGSPNFEFDRNPSEQLHWTRINRSFAIAATETTVAEFQRFLRDPTVQRAYELKPFSFTSDYAPTPDCPQTSVSWYDAARFCQWLSEQEGIPADQWCYPDIWQTDLQRFTLPADYLTRTGYRLPTEAEWEFACRANSTTSRPQGDADFLLDPYAWYRANSDERTQPVAQRKPNDFGLFDMLGNVHEWCQEPFAAYRASSQGYAREDVVSPRSKLEVSPADYRVSRGGSYGDAPKTLRSANRGRAVPTSNSVFHGFRVARTIETARP